MSSSSAHLPAPEGSVSGVPNLEFLAPYRENGGRLQ